MDETQYPTLSVRDVARLIGKSTRSVRNIRATDLPYVQLEERGRRAYRERDLAAYLERNTVRT